METDLRAKKERLMKEANWDDLLLKDKLRLIDLWSIVAILGNVFEVMGSAYSIFRDKLELLQSAD